jgi:hypothetical protein
MVGCSRRGDLENLVFGLFLQAPETTVPAFAGTVFIVIYSEELTSSWQPSSCRLSSSQTSLLSLP